MKFKSSPRSLHIRCSLNPKNQLMKHLPLCTIPLNVLWIWILWFLHTRKGILSMKLIPVHLPKNTFLMNRASGIATFFSNSTKSGYMRWPWGIDGAYACIPFPDRNISDNGIPNHGKSIMISITSAFDLVEARWYGRFVALLTVYHHCIKKRADIICHTK